MDLATIAMEPEEAAEKLEHFRRLRPSQLTEDDLATIAGYEALVAGNAVLDLAAAMRDAGLADDMPRLAVARADQRSATFERHRDGGGTFKGDRYQGDVRTSRMCVRLPEGTWTFAADRPENWRLRGLCAYLPSIPPEHRPAPSQLYRYHVLWEAIWEPAPPGDPFLLKYLAGTLYVVLAQWDLTPLEQAVLQGRIRRDSVR